MLPRLPLLQRRWRRIERGRKWLQLSLAASNPSAAAAAAVAGLILALPLPLPLPLLLRCLEVAATISAHLARIRSPNTNSPNGHARWRGDVSSHEQLRTSPASALASSPLAVPPASRSLSCWQPLCPALRASAAARMHALDNSQFFRCFNSYLALYSNSVHPLDFRQFELRIRVWELNQMVDLF